MDIGTGFGDVFQGRFFDPAAKGRARKQAADRATQESEEKKDAAESYGLLKFEREKRSRAKGRKSTILTGK